MSARIRGRFLASLGMTTEDMPEILKASQENQAEVEPLTYKEKFEMVRNLELKDIEDYQFYHPAEACLDLKDYYKDMHEDPVRGLIAFSDRYHYIRPDAVISNVNERVAIHPLPNPDLVKENGLFQFNSKFMCFGVYGRKDRGRKAFLHEALGEEPTLENIQKVSNKIQTEEGNIIKSEQEKLLKALSINLGSDIYIQFVDYYSYLFSSGKKYDPSGEEGDPTELIPKIKLNYKGHKFEIMSKASLSNDAERGDLSRLNNPLLIERIGYFDLFIDGKKYSEKSLDPKFGKESEGQYNMFNSWRKWCGLEDLVVGPAEDSERRK